MYLYSIRIHSYERKWVRLEAGHLSECVLATRTQKKGTWKRLWFVAQRHRQSSVTSNCHFLLRAPNCPRQLSSARSGCCGLQKPRTPVRPSLQIVDRRAEPMCSVYVSFKNNLHHEIFSAFQEAECKMESLDISV